MRRILKVAVWGVVCVVVSLISIYLWAHVGLVLLGGIALATIGAVIRALVRELQGKRHDGPYVAGPVRMSDIPSRPQRFRHHRTPNDPG